MRAYSATVGATDGNIIAAIITTQTPRNQPSAPSAVPGPASIPLMRWAVDHHATTASAKSSAIRPRRARVAASAGARPRWSRWSRAKVLTSRRPREARVRERRPALVLDAERVDARPHRPRDRQLRAGRMEDPRQPRGLARLDPERDDVLDLEVDRVADRHAVAQPVLVDLDRHALDAEALADERNEPCHRPAE